jgi:hypothetical protein
METVVIHILIYVSLFSQRSLPEIFYRSSNLRENPTGEGSRLRRLVPRPRRAEGLKPPYGMVRAVKLSAGGKVCGTVVGP